MTTPVIAGLVAFISLFFIQNVFNISVQEADVEARGLAEETHISLSREGLDILTEEDKKFNSATFNILDGYLTREE